MKYHSFDAPEWARYTAIDCCGDVYAYRDCPYQTHDDSEGWFSGGITEYIGNMCVTWPNWRNTLKEIE